MAAMAQRGPQEVLSEAFPTLACRGMAWRGPGLGGCASVTVRTGIASTPRDHAALSALHTFARTTLTTCPPVGTLSTLGPRG